MDLDRPHSTQSAGVRVRADTTLDILKRALKKEKKAGDLFKALQVVNEKRDGRLFSEDFIKIWNYCGEPLNQTKIRGLFDYFKSCRPNGDSTRRRARNYVTTEQFQKEIYGDLENDEIASLRTTSHKGIDQSASISGSRMLPKLKMEQLSKSKRTKARSSDSRSVKGVQPEERAALKTEGQQVVENNSQLKELRVISKTLVCDVIDCFELSKEIAEKIKGELKGADVKTMEDLRTCIETGEKWQHISLPDLFSNQLKALCYVINIDKRTFEDVLDHAMKRLGGQFVGKRQEFVEKAKKFGIVTIGQFAEVLDDALWRQFEFPGELRIAFEVEMAKPQAEVALQSDRAMSCSVPDTSKSTSKMSTARSRSRVDAMGLFSQPAMPKCHTAIHIAPRPTKKFGQGKAVYTPLYNRVTLPLRKGCQKRQLTKPPKAAKPKDSDKVLINVARVQTPSTGLTEWDY